MKDASYERALQLLCTELNCDSLSQLGKALGISSQAVYDAKKRKVIPTSWLQKAMNDFGVNTAEIECLLVESAGMEMEDKAQLAQASNTSLLAQALNELSLERQERRELNAENRELLKKNAELLVQIAELKSQISNSQAPPQNERAIAEEKKTG